MKEGKILNKNLLQITTHEVIEECLAESLDVREKPALFLKKATKSQAKIRKVLK